jgi:hypothetical protein
LGAGESFFVEESSSDGKIADKLNQKSEYYLTFYHNLPGLKTGEDNFSPISPAGDSVL